MPASSVWLSFSVFGISIVLVLAEHLISTRDFFGKPSGTINEVNFIVSNKILKEEMDALEDLKNNKLT